MESASFGMHAAAYAAPFPATFGIAPAAHEHERLCDSVGEAARMERDASQTAQPSAASSPRITAASFPAP
jgi:hypothetical protein